MIDVHSYICEFCNKKFLDKDRCKFHEESLCESQPKIDWKIYTFTKTGRGFSDTWYVNINPKLLETYHIDNEELCRMIGEYTDGGEQSGWDVTLDSVRDWMICEVPNKCSSNSHIIDKNFILEWYDFED